ncbi:MAG: TRAP transporter substrate-binding protein [Proteobacteria bacterium]|nr:TRAP transporter substrate-binding protein [Pseudomonadota bacterium]MBI3498084.1 TRAP transporter substrate-binding protein [Pseudomonadota bacterium]
MSIARGCGRFVLAWTAVLALVLIGGIEGARAQTKLTFSHHVPTNHILHEAAERFAKRVSELTQGQVTVEVRPASQLFNLRTSAEALQLGTLDFAWTDLGSLANWQPYLGFTSVPFLFNDFDHAFKVLYGPIGEQVRKEVLEKLGIDILSLGASGFRIFVLKKPVHMADDLKGMKLRVPEIPVYVDMARALGTNPTPIPAGEIYTALQTGVVDGMEGPPDFVETGKLFEVGGYATRTYHIMTEVSLMASAKRLGALPPAHQKAVRDAAVEVVQGWYKQENLKAQESSMQILRGKLKMDEKPDIASFRAKMGPVIDSFVAKVGPKGREYVDAVLAAGK